MTSAADLGVLARANIAMADLLKDLTADAADKCAGIEVALAHFAELRGFNIDDTLPAVFTSFVAGHAKFGRRSPTDFAYLANHELANLQMEMLSPVPNNISMRKRCFRIINLLRRIEHV